MTTIRCQTIRKAILNVILDADAIIISTPTYSHQPPGVIKALFDRIGGPYVDASFAELVRQGQAAGDPNFANMNFDPRLQKPRVLASWPLAVPELPILWLYPVSMSSFTQCMLKSWTNLLDREWLLADLFFL